MNSKYKNMSNTNLKKDTKIVKQKFVFSLTTVIYIFKDSLILTKPDV